MYLHILTFSLRPRYILINIYVYIYFEVFVYTCTYLHILTFSPRPRYIIINGRKSVTDRFCGAIHDGKPVFIFKHTGDSADLICEALKEAREYAKVWCGGCGWVWVCLCVMGEGPLF